MSEQDFIHKASLLIFFHIILKLFYMKSYDFSIFSLSNIDNSFENETDMSLAVIIQTEMLCNLIGLISRRAAYGYVL